MYCVVVFVCVPLKSIKFRSKQVADLFTIKFLRLASSTHA